MTKQQSTSTTIIELTEDGGQELRYAFQEVEYPSTHPKRIQLSLAALMDLRDNGIGNLAMACAEFKDRTGYIPQDDEEFAPPVVEGDDSATVVFDIGDWILVPELAAARNADFDVFNACDIQLDPYPIRRVTPMWYEAQYPINVTGQGIRQVDAPMQCWDARISPKSGKAAIRVDSIQRLSPTAHVDTSKHERNVALGIGLYGHVNPLKMCEYIAHQYGPEFASKDDSGFWNLSERVMLALAPEAEWDFPEGEEQHCSHILQETQASIVIANDEQVSDFIQEFLITRLNETMNEIANEVAAADAAVDAAINPVEPTTTTQAPASTSIQSSGSLEVYTADGVTDAKDASGGTDLTRLLNHPNIGHAGATRGTRLKNQQPTKKSHHKFSGENAAGEERPVPKTRAPVPKFGAQTSAARKFLEAIPVARQELKDGDGILNASASGVTELGRFLDLNAKCCFDYAHIGEVHSIGALWNWLCTHPDLRESRLLLSHGTSNRNYKPKKRYDQPGFKSLLADATMAKIVSNPKMREAFTESTDQIQLYHIHSESGDLINVHRLAAWYVPALEEIRRVLKALKAGGLADGEIEPDFGFLEIDYSQYQKPRDNDGDYDRNHDRDKRQDRPHWKSKHQQHRN